MPIAPFESSSCTMEEDAECSGNKNIDWTGKAEDCRSQGLAWGYKKRNNMRIDEHTYNDLQQIVPLCHVHSKSSLMHGLEQETIPYAKTSQAEYTGKQKISIYLVWDEWNNFLMTTPFQRLSAYNILRSWKTYQLHHIQVEERNHIAEVAEKMWFYVGSLHILNLNESNDKWCDACQRTQPYSINVESNTYGELDKVNAIKAHYLHLHNSAIRNLSTVKYRIRKSPKRTYHKRGFHLCCG